MTESMNVVLFGATGMVGQGVLREVLLTPDIERVVAVVRKPIATQHPRLEQVVHRDFTDYSDVGS